MGTSAEIIAIHTGHGGRPMTDGLRIEDAGGAVLFEVRVAPRASRDAVGGQHDGALKVSLTAPPVEGAANAALIKLLSKRLGVAKQAIEVVSGAQRRNKRLRVVGVGVDDVRALCDDGGGRTRLKPDADRDRTR